LTTVAATLQRYADRGVFRGFSARPPRRGRQQFTFEWLTRRPMTLTYEARTRTLRFPNVFPGVAADRALATELTTIVASRTKGQRGRAADVPEHRRVDGRRAKVACSLRGGHLSLILDVRGRHEAYAVRRGLTLVQDLFLRLHEAYPEYLVEHFGLSTE
jgi:hypothetical protein